MTEAPNSASRSLSPNSRDSLGEVFSGSSGSVVFAGRFGSTRMMGFWIAYLNNFAHLFKTYQSEKQLGYDENYLFRWFSGDHPL